MRLIAIFALVCAAGLRRRWRETASRGSLRSRALHGACNGGADHTDLCTRSGDAGRGAARCGSGGPRGAVRAWRGNSGRGLVRCGLSGLQLDGVSGARGVRRVLDGYDRLWAFHASDGNERLLQSVERAAEGVRADALPRELRAADDDDRFRLERYRGGGGPSARAAACGSGVDGGVVAGRTAGGRVYGATSG